MGSACDDGSIPPPSGPERIAISRRGLLVGAVATLMTACVRGGVSGPGQGKGIWYTSRVGDTLTSISRRSGLPVEEISAINRLETSLLPTGTRLWLPRISYLAPEPTTRPAEPKPAVVSAPKQPRKPVEAVDGDHYEIVPRSAWTTEPVGPNHVLMGRVQRITIHHTDEHAGMADLPDLEVVRRIERYHRGPEKRWAAIGYHYLVGKDGKIYEGRPVKYQGAHVSANNENNLGISVIGDFNSHLPNAKQMVALKAFLDDQCIRFSVPKDRVFGHRDLKTTICPGAALYSWVNSYRNR